jgi:hypothetical protein
MMLSYQGGFVHSEYVSGSGLKLTTAYSLSLALIFTKRWTYDELFDQGGEYWVDLTQIHPTIKE